MVMLEASGDLWEYPAEYRVVTTNAILRSNGCLVMGAGVAKQARDRFPGLDKKLGDLVKRYGNRPFLCREEDLITLPTKTNWREKSCPTLISRSVMELVRIVNKFNIASVVMTRPGCGNGGLEWSQVKPLLMDVLDDRFTVLAPSPSLWVGRLQRRDFMLLGQSPG